LSTLVVTFKAEAGGITLFEVPFSVQLPIQIPIPFPPPDPLDFLLGLLLDALGLPFPLEIPSLPCPFELDLLSLLPPIPPIIIPGLPPIPFPPPDPLDFLIGALLNALGLAFPLEIPSLPCPFELDLLSLLPPIPPIIIPGLPPIPFPPPDPLDFLIGALLDFLGIPDIEIPSLPCPFPAGITLTIDVKVIP